MFTRPLSLALVALFALLTLPGCKTKPSAAFYQGTGPSIHYHETETVGGAVRTTKYR